MVVIELMVVAPKTIFWLVSWKHGMTNIWEHFTQLCKKISLVLITTISKLRWMFSDIFHNVFSWNKPKYWLGCYNRELDWFNFNASSLPLYLRWLLPFLPSRRLIQIQALCVAEPHWLTLLASVARSAPKMQTVLLWVRLVLLTLGHEVVIGPSTSTKKCKP